MIRVVVYATVNEDVMTEDDFSLMVGDECMKVSQAAGATCW